MLAWNVWSIANEEKLNNFLQILDDQKISIACITETWFDRKNGKFSKTIKDAGFELHHTFREDKRGGGSAIIYKRDMSVKKGGASSSIYSSFEYSYVTLTLQSKRKLIMVCLYRKQEVAFNIFHDELTLIMDKLSNVGDSLLLVGDFNVWADNRDDKHVKMLEDLLSAYGLIQTVEGPTHRSGHTLDHIYINPYQLDVEHEVIIESWGLTTDHYPLLLQIPSGGVENKTQTLYYRKLKDVHIDAFNIELQNSLTVSLYIFHNSIKFLVKLLTTSCNMEEKMS